MSKRSVDLKFILTYQLYVDGYMLPFKNLIFTDKSCTTPIYSQITGQLTALIQDGTIRPGSFLPGTRQMAELLAVNRKTVINAYEELRIQNWIDVVPQKGYRVIPELSLIKPRSYHPKDNFGHPEGTPGKLTAKYLQGGYKISARAIEIVVDDGLPDARLFPYLKMHRVYRDYGKNIILKSSALAPEEAGSEQIRGACSDFLNSTRGLNICMDRIVMTGSSQMAIFIATSIILSPGDVVVMGDPIDPHAQEVIKNAGAEIVAVRMDNEGIDTDELENLINKYRVKMLYIAPQHHHPTTVTLSDTRRENLLRLIHSHGFWVVEDDSGYDFHYENSPIMPLASANHAGKVIYVGSFDKIFSASFRVGYLVAKPEVIAKVIRLKGIMDLKGDIYMERMVSGMIRTGDLRRHIKKSNKLYFQRCNFVCDLLNAKLGHILKFTKPQGGLALWLRFSTGYPVAKLIAMASKAGLLLKGTHLDDTGSAMHNGIRFGYASLSEAEMTRAVDILLKVTGQLADYSKVSSDDII